LFLFNVVGLVSRDLCYAWLFSDDPKNGHLKELEGGKERLTLHKVDLFDIDSIKEALNGCHGVFHTASPVTDNPVSFNSRSLISFYHYDFSEPVQVNKLLHINCYFYLIYKNICSSLFILLNMLIVQY